MKPLNDSNDVVLVTLLEAMDVIRKMSLEEVDREIDRYTVMITPLVDQLELLQAIRPIIENRCDGTRGHLQPRVVDGAHKAMEGPRRPLPVPEIPQSVILVSEPPPPTVQEPARKQMTGRPPKYKKGADVPVTQASPTLQSVHKFLVSNGPAKVQDIADAIGKKYPTVYTHLQDIRYFKKAEGCTYEARSAQ